MTSAVPLIACAAAGAALGVVYFAALGHSVRLLVAGAPASRVVLLTLLRGAAAVAVFWAVAQHGAAALGVALAGFLAARLVVQRRAGRGP